MLPILLLSLAVPLLCQGVNIRALTGAPVDATISASDPNVLFAVDAINSFYAKQGVTATRTLVDVVKAQTQVVAGTLYHLWLKVSAGGQTEMCEVNVWSRPWLSGDEATQVTQDPTCKPVTDVKVTKAPLLGGENQIDINDDSVQKALTFAVDSMNAQENFMFYRKAVNVEKVTSQVVSGMAYHFRGVHMSATNCVKNGNGLTHDCLVADGADTKVCDFDIWYQAWMTPQYKLTNLSCQ